MSNLPDEIQTIIDQAGGLGFRGAFTYIGAHKYRYTHEYEKWNNARELEDGSIDLTMGLIFDVNAGNRGWKMAVHLDLDDTYSVWLWRPLVQPKRRSVVVYAGSNVPPKELYSPELQKKEFEVLDHSSGIYCDELQGEIERMYDRAIKKYIGGIPI